MPVVFRVEAEGFRDEQGRFARRSDELVAQRRAMVRTSAQIMLAWLRSLAPKKSGLFAEGINYRTDERAGGTTTATFYVKGEHAFLLPFLTQGTGLYGPKGSYYLIPKGGRAAQMAKGYPLHWISEGGLDIYAWEVNHPGIHPNPFVQKAKNAGEPAMRDAVQSAARSVAFLK